MTVSLSNYGKTLRISSVPCMSETIKFLPCGDTPRVRLETES